MLENRTFTLTTFEDICLSLASSFPSREATYAEFVVHVQGYLEAPLKGGNYLDRVILERRRNTGNLGKEDLSLFMTMLLLALETEFIEDRARALFKLLTCLKSGTTVELNDVSAVIDYLFLTSQIPVEKKVIKAEKEYPVQTYEEATPQQLVSEALTELKLSPQDTKVLGEEEFVNLLLSNAICAWGSCRPRR
jgi:hypothetical protein